MAKIIIDIPDEIYRKCKLSLGNNDIIGHAIAEGKEVPPEGLYTFENLEHLRDNIFDSINAKFCEIATRIEE